jgi:hypothetical protein
VRRAVAICDCFTVFEVKILRIFGKECVRKMFSLAGTPGSTLIMRFDLTAGCNTMPHDCP